MKRYFLLLFALCIVAITKAQVPVNDNVCNAIALTLNGASDCQTTESATVETSEPTYACSTPNNTVWYAYTPAVDGTVQIKVKKNPAAIQDLNAWIHLFTASGTCPGGLTMTDFTTTCDNADLTTNDSVSIVTDALTAGTTYYIMVDGFSGAVGGFCIQLADLPPPPPCTTLISPADNATNVAVPTQLSWDSLVTADGYNVVLDTNNPPTTLLGNSVAASASITGLAYNTTYYWTINPTAAGVPATGCGVFTFTTGAAPAGPVNDDMCNAIVLTLNGASDCENTETATVETNEPTFACSTPNNTVWYTYTPAVDGSVQIKVKKNPGAAQDLDAWIHLFTASGTCPGGLTMTEFSTSCNEADLTANDSVTIVSDALTAGTTYYIMVDGFAGAVGGFCINLQDAPPPPPCTTLIAPFDTETNVAVPAQLLWNAAPGADGYDVVLDTNNPPTTLLGNTVDTTVGITGLAYNTTYYWTINPTSSGVAATGCTVFSFTTGAAPAAPVNDDMCNAIALTLNGPSDCENTETATVETNEPTFACSTPNNTLWYTYTPAVDGSVQITIKKNPTATQDLNAWVHLFTATGTCPGGLTLTEFSTSCNNADLTLNDSVVIISDVLTAGITYYIMVDGFSGAVGGFCINLSDAPPPIPGPINDTICNAIALTLNGASDCQTTENATVEANEPTFACSTPNNTVWYTYTPTVNGPIQITIKKNTSATQDLDAWISLFTATGTCPGGLTLTEFSTTCNEANLTANDSVVIVSDALTAGTTYYIMVDGFSGAVGGFCINLSDAPTPPPCTTLISPANNATNVAVPVQLTWNSAPGANGYDVVLDTNNPPTTLLGNTVDTTVGITGLLYNTTYYWTINPTNTGVAASGCTVFSFTTGNAPLAPPNDTICNAIVLTLNGPSDCETTETATVDANEPTFACSTPNNTVWYTYTPTADGPVQIKVKKNPAATQDLNAWIHLFTATGTCPNLTLTEFSTSCNNANLTLNDSVLIVTDILTAGVTYYIMVDGFSGAVGGFCINIMDVAPVVACATLISPANNATNIPAPATQLTWNTSTGADGYDVALGTVNPPSVLGNTADTSVTITALSFNTTYYWSITPTVGGIPITGCTTVYSFTTGSSPAPPANDPCSGAIGLVADVSVSGTTVNATQSLPATTCNGSTGDANDDVWYTITALYNGNANVTVTPNIGFDAVVEAFTGTCAGTLTSLACADNLAAGGIETLSLTNLTPGQVIYIRVFEFGSVGSENTFNIIASGSALPIKLISFKGERIGSRNALSWSTASEQNNRGFELQRSADGQSFSSMTFVQSKATNGNSSTALSYQFNDEKPFSGNNYYRLKQVDFDGKSTYSNIVLIKGIRSTSITMSAVYPNPVKETLKVVLSAPGDNNVDLIVTDIAGKILMQKPATVISGDNVLSINVRQLPSGSYMIKAICANGCETTVSKFVKQ